MNKPAGFTEDERELMAVHLLALDATLRNMVRVTGAAEGRRSELRLQLIDALASVRFAGREAFRGWPASSRGGRAEIYRTMAKAAANALFQAALDGLKFHWLVTHGDTKNERVKAYDR